MKTALPFVFLLLSHPIAARQLSYLESHLFRISGHNEVSNWLLPFKVQKRNTPKYININIFSSANKESPDIIKGLNSKNKNLLESKLISNYGTPNSISAKAIAGIKKDKLSINFSSNAGGFAIVNDPVFPEARLLFFQDYVASSSYKFSIKNDFKFIPRITFIKRRVLDTTFSTASFIDNKPDTKIKNKPWKALRELNLASSYKTIIGSLEFEINSFPLSKNDYRYWDTNLGLYSKNLKNIWKALPIQELHFYTSYSPFYGGNYDVFRTFKAGFKTTVNKYITFDLFLEDESLIGAIIKTESSNFSLSLLTFEKSYDDYHTQKVRNYGVNLTAQY